jgi:ABC-type transporter Mla MlaB component
MLLVSRTEGRSCTVLSIDGRLSSDSIGVVEGFCARAISTGRQVRLILHDVTEVDQAGNAMLCRLVARGVRLRGNDRCTSYPAKALDRTGTEPLNAALDGKHGSGGRRRTL